MALVALALCAGPALGAQLAEGDAGADLTDLSLEQLLEVEIAVTSAGRKSQPISETASAIYVITGEDLRRSGARSLPEALRMVPGVQVARVNSSTWAISARGFNDVFANKLLVLIDGRSVYTPTFSGVFWDVQDVLLEDVDRVEVIRGPGAALWGSNAVNGVINVITKHTSQTTGGSLTLGGGTEEQAFGSVRYGDRLGEDAFYRAYAKGFARDGLHDVDGEGIEDDWSQARAGFRVDWSPSEDDDLTVSGDAYHGHSDGATTLGLPSPPYFTLGNIDYDLGGANLLTRWTHRFADESELALQTYYDHVERTGSLSGQRLDTVDLDLQHRVPLGGGNELVWGLGYRNVRSRTPDRFTIQYDPAARTTELFSAFAQDELKLSDSLSVILGTKVEHNDYTGVEVQPNARAVWHISERRSAWAAVSRAVRTPSRTEDDVRLFQGVMPGSPPLTVLLLGNDDFDSEELVAYELGYRFEPTEDLSLDLAAFVDDYDRLASVEVGAPDAMAGVLPITIQNRGAALTYGFELAADWRPAPDWRARLAYSFLRLQVEADAGSGDATLEDTEDESPRNQVSVSVWHALTDEVELDTSLYWVDALDAFDVDAYLRADVRLGWRPQEDLELSLVLQGLFHDEEAEFGRPAYNGRTAVETGVYGMVTWRF